MTTAKIVERKRKMLIKLKKVCVGPDKREPARAERVEDTVDSNMIKSMEIVKILSKTGRNMKVTKIIMYHSIFPIYVTQTIEEVMKKCFS